MPNNFTIKHGIKLGIGFSIGTAIFNLLDKGLAKALTPYSRRLTEKIVKATDKAVYGDEPIEQRYDFRRYRPVQTTNTES